MSLTESVAEALDSLPAEPVDAAARELARVYARQIDDCPATLVDIGPKLLAVLESLGMTPRARAAATKGSTGGAARSPLDELRNRRARRDGAPPVDPATG